MPSQIQITSFTGALPASVYVSDVYGNNTILAGTLTSPLTLPQIINLPTPSIFDFAPAVMIKIVDNNGCEDFTIDECLVVFPSPTATSTPTPTPTVSETPTQTPTPTPTPTPTISETPTQTPSPTVTPDASPSSTPTPTISESATPTPTPDASPSSTPTPTPTISETPTQTPTPTISETPTQTPTPTISESATPTPTPTISESATPTPTPTISESATPTPTPTISESATPTPTPTISESPTGTPTQTPTPTPSPSVGCPQCEEFVLTAAFSGNCGEYFTYTDCITQNTITVGLSGATNLLTSWFTPPYGTNPLTVCSCDIPDLTFAIGCGLSVSGTTTACNPYPSCTCHDVIIAEADTGLLPIYLNVRNCSGTLETKTFASTGTYKICIREHYDLYSLFGGNITAVSVSSFVTNTFISCSSDDGCLGG